MYKMKICHILENMDVGGIQTVVLNMALMLAADKFDVTVAYYSSKRCHYDSELEQGGVHVIRIGCSDHRPLMSRVKLKRFFSEKQFDVIHYHMSDMHYVLPITCAPEGTRLVIHAHSSNSSYKPIVNALNHHLHKRNTQIVLKKAQIFLACSDLAAQWFKMPDGYIFFKNGIELDKYRYNPKHRIVIRNSLGLDDSSIVIGYVARFSKPKNHRFLLAAFLQAIQAHPNCRLLLIGDGPEEVHIRSMASSLGLSEYVIFLTGGINAAPYYSAMDVFAMPSLYEGFPVVLVEAQANGLPVIYSSNITGDACILKSCVRAPVDLSDASLSVWAKYFVSQNTRIYNAKDILQKEGFDVDAGIRVLESVYCS